MTSDGLNNSNEASDAASSESAQADEQPRDAPLTDDQPTDDDQHNDLEPSTSNDDGEASEELSVDQLTAAFANLMGEAEGTDEDDETEELDAASNETSVDRDDEQADVKQIDKAATASPDNEHDDTPVTPESIVEAILFVGHPQNDPLTARLMASYLRGVSPNEVDSLIEELNATYERQNAAYRISSEGAGYRMTLREDLGWLREAFYGKVREAKLTQAAIDLLAIVAYHQPVERSRVDALRGQPSGAVLNQLVRRELLSVEYTDEKPRKKMFRTTERFLDLFGLESIEDLPSYA